MKPWQGSTKCRCTCVCVAAGRSICLTLMCLCLCTVCVCLCVCLCARDSRFLSLSLSHSPSVSYMCGCFHVCAEVCGSVRVRAHVDVCLCLSISLCLFAHRTINLHVIFKQSAEPLLSLSVLNLLAACDAQGSELCTRSSAAAHPAIQRP